MKTKLPTLLAASLFVASFSPSVKAANDSGATAKIAELGQAYVDAFAKGDAKTISALWAPDADYIDQFGHRTSGREALEKLFTQFFAENKGAQLRVDSESLNVVTPELAIEDGTSAVVSPGEPLPSRARFTNTFVKKDGKWLLASVRESPFFPPDRAAELSGLGWLLGEWETRTKAGETVALSVQPASGGNFLVSRRVVLVNGGPVSGGTEWIAWDPAKKLIRSWSFDADGGFGESTWKQDGGAWTIESAHTLRDGTQLREIQSLQPDGKGSVTVKTLGLSANEKDLPKPEDFVFQRPKTN